MNQRPRLLGAIVIACLALTLYFVVRTPAEAGLTVLTHTTLEEFNTGEFYHTGLTRVDDGEVQLLVVGIAGEWIDGTNATGLPARDRHTAVYHNGHIIVVGGKEVDTLAKRDVYYTTIQADDHDLADWQKTTALPLATYPNGLMWHASVVVRDRIYVLGGYDAINELAAVSSAPINANGTVGAWSTTSPLPVPLRMPQAAVVNGRIYVAGGRTDEGDISDQVYYATPDPNTGQITHWSATTAPLPYPTRGHMVTVWDNRLYVMGGTDGEVISYKVHYAQPNATTGDISAFVETTNMRNNLYGAVGLAYNAVLFTTGGAINQMSAPSSYVGADLVALDGTIGNWQDTSDLSPERFFHAAVCTDDGWLYVIHGNNGSAPFASINRGATAGPGGDYAWDGTYTSRTIELPKNSELKELSWNTTIDDPDITSITFWYRSRLTATAEWPEWSGPFLSAVQGTVTHTLPLDGFARYFQYRADFSTEDTDVTPVLNAVQLTYLPPVYSIRLTKAATPPSGSEVLPDDVIRYTLTYSNSFTGLTATNASILDMMPLHVQYVPGSIYGTGADDSGAPELIWNLGDVPPGGQGEVGFSAVVLNDYAEEALIENRGILFSESGPVQYSNLVTHTATVLGPRLEVEKTADPPPGSQVGLSSRITYTVNYSNPTLFMASQAVLTDTYDPHESYAVLSTQPAASDASGSVWQLGDLPPGSSGQVEVLVELAGILPNHWPVTNQVDLGFAETTRVVTDVVSHMVVYDGVPLVDFRIDDIRWQPLVPLPGEPVKFSATLTNQGTAAAGEFFWVSLYIKPQPSIPPLGPSDHVGGYCLDASCTTLRPHFLAYVPSLAPGASVEIVFQDLEADPVFPAGGAYDIYVQADMAFVDPLNPDYYNPYWGHYPEDYEQNNQRLEVLKIPVGPPRVYLPVVSCADR